MSASSECPFCEIVDRDDPDVREVYRDEHAVAFFPTEPAVLGHTMVVPRAHVPDIWGLSDEPARNLSSSVLKVASAIREALEPQGLNVIQSNGHAASQTVMHLHIHLVPRNEGDRIGRIWPPESDYSEAAKDEALAELREAIREISKRS